MKKLMISLLLVVCSLGIAQAAEKALIETQDKFAPVADKYFSAHAEEYLNAGNYATKLIAGCDPTDPIYEVNYKAPITKAIAKLKSKQTATR